MTKGTAKTLIIVCCTLLNVTLMFAITTVLSLIAYFSVKFVKPELFFYLFLFCLLLGTFLGAKLYQKLAKKIIAKYALEQYLM